MYRGIDSVAALEFLSTHAGEIFVVCIAIFLAITTFSQLWRLLTRVLRTVRVEPLEQDPLTRNWVQWYKDQAEIDEQKRKHPLEQEAAAPTLKVERVFIGLGDDGEMIFGDVEVEDE